MKKFSNMFRKLLGLDNVEVLPQNDELKLSPEELEAERLTQFYGVDEDGQPIDSFYHLIVGLREIGWSEPHHSTIYILTDLEKYVEKVSVWGLMSVWREMGKSEWEFILSVWLMSALRKAWKEGLQETDITNLFNHDLLATNNRIKTRDQVIEHISKVFTVVEENDTEIRLTLNVK